MKKWALGISFLVVLTGCEPKQEKAVVETAAVKKTPAERKIYAYRPTQYTWPVAGKTSQVTNSLLTSNYYLVIDGSGSMNDVGCSGNRRKIDVAKEAVTRFVDSIPKDANVGLLVFDDKGIGERVPLGGNYSDIKREVASISANRGTPLLSAMRLAYRSITKQAQDQLGYGEYHMVVVTDGEANSGEDPSELVDKILQESSVIIHTIGFCIGDGHSLNVVGQIDYRAANNPAELQAGLQSVLAESTEYSPTTFSKDGVSQ